MDNIKRIFAVLIIFIIICFSALHVEGNHKRGIITVVFRYDDYSGLSDTELEINLINAFKKHEIPFTIGVIPYVAEGNTADPKNNPHDVIPLNSVKAEILKSAIQEGTVDVALHGYSHQTISGDPKSEFSGLDYDSQVSKIVKGKNLLEKMLDKQITTFIPPFNRYDLETLKALEQLGFRTISAGEFGGVTLNSAGLKYLPSTSGLLDFREAINKARKVSDMNTIVVVLFHSYDFSESRDDLAKLKLQDLHEILKWVKSQRDIRMLTISQISEKRSEEVEYLGPDRFANYSSIFGGFLYDYLIPPIIKNKMNWSHQYYPPMDFFKKGKIKIKVWLVGIIFYFSVLLVSIIVTLIVRYSIFPRSVIFESLATLVAPLSLFLLVIYIFHDLDISYKGAICLTFNSGICIGILLYKYNLLHKKDAGKDGETI